MRTFRRWWVGRRCRYTFSSGSSLPRMRFSRLSFSATSGCFLKESREKGELDILLTKPVPALFLALTRSIYLTAIFNIFLGLAIAVRFAEPAGFPGGARWLLVGVWLLVGMLAAVLVRFAF